MIKKLLSTFAVVSGVLLVNATGVSAHVTVKPNEVVIAKSQVFTISVPVEKEVPTTEIRLVLPEGLENVRPNAKAGWTIELKKDGDKVKEILWKNGNIPVDLRDEFLFSAKAPAKATTIQWKAYQKYSDGTVVSWDQAPKKEEAKGEEESNSGPYSETKIIDDLTNADKNSSTNNSVASSTIDNSTKSYAIGATILSVIALCGSAFAVMRSTKRKASL